MIESDSNKHQASNLLLLKPERRMQWERDADSKLAVILVPKFQGKLLGRFLQPRLRHPYEKINLDNFGTVVWESCDGSTTVDEIANQLRDRFGNEVEPLHERLALFLRMLEEKKLIRYTNLTDVRAEEITQA